MAIGISPTVDFAVSDLHLEFGLRDRRHGLSLTDKLQIHLLQLPNSHVRADNVKGATPIEQWAYFLRNAERLTPAEIAQQLPEREFGVAAGVLQMIAQPGPEKYLYEARLKFQRDEQARLEKAELVGLSKGRVEGLVEGRVEGRIEGLVEGLAKGQTLGQILLCQKLLGLPQSSAEELAGLDPEQLAALANELQSRLQIPRN